VETVVAGCAAVDFEAFGAFFAAHGEARLN
jgi:hypothetical protein